MKTLQQFGRAHQAGRLQIPAATVWYLTELSEARGKQELFTRQSPQRLKALRESALVESAVSSNRIEGVEVRPSRVATVVFGSTRLRDRDEKEVRGYRAALAQIHQRGARLPASEDTIRELHAQSRAGIADAGEYRTSDSDINIRNACRPDAIAAWYEDRARPGRDRSGPRTVPRGRSPARVSRCQPRHDPAHLETIAAEWPRQVPRSWTSGGMAPDDGLRSWLRCPTVAYG